MNYQSIERSSKVESFYSNYHGHTVPHLDQVLKSIKTMKSSSDSSIIYLAGDSSLDNKFWFTDRASAVNGYEKILSPPTSIKDIAYWLNYEIEKQGKGEILTALNCAIEESTIERRAYYLLPQDNFIRNTITSKDVLILSVGGNDIALRPQLCTIVNTFSLIFCTTTECINSCTCGCALPCDEYCSGCTTSCLSDLCAFPCGYGYFLHLFGTRVQSLANRLISGENRPKKVLICTIYFLDENQTHSWANVALSGLGYNQNPKHLQTLIRKVFEQATSKINIPGTEVIPVPLFVALDGKDTTDYSQRVEPSAIGGQKMAKLLLEAIEGGAPRTKRLYDEFVEKIER
jgi:hypothetical protein